MRYLLTVTLFTFFYQATTAQNETLDHDFNGTGMIIKSINGNGGEAFFVQELTDGKILAACNCWNGNNGDICLLRFHHDGQVDISFGINGVAVADIDNQTENGYDAVIQPDGKILVTGYSYDYDISMSNFAFIIRFLPEGGLDTTFGHSGIVSDNFGFKAVNTYSISVLKNDRIIIGGRIDLGTFTSHWQFAIFGFTPTGTMDSSFGTNGLIIKDYGEYIESGVAKIETFEDSGFVVLGGWLNIGVDRRITLHKFNNAGIQDLSFGNNGIAYFVANTEDAIVGTDTGFIYSSALTIQPDNKFFVAGTFIKDNDPFTNNALLARYNFDGSLDSTFDADGCVVYEIDLDDSGISSVLLQQDNKIILAGTIYYADQDIILLRYNSDGALDTTFGMNGISTFAVDPFFAYNLDICNSAALQQDGKILIAGFHENSFANTYGALILRALPVTITNEVQDEKKPPFIKVYPNPFSEEIVLKSFLSESSVAEISLYDLTGRIVEKSLKHEFRALGEYVDVLSINERVPNGSYILVLQTAHGIAHSVIHKN